MKCNATDEFLGETHTCIGLPGHDSFHSCGCKPARMWNRLDERGLTADDEPVQRKAGTRLDPERLAEIRGYVNAAIAEGPCGDRFPAEEVAALLAHIDVLEAERDAGSIIYGAQSRAWKYVERLADEAKACGVTGLDPCPWHPDGDNHPTSAP